MSGNTLDHIFKELKEVNKNKVEYLNDRNCRKILRDI